MGRGVGERGGKEGYGGRWRGGFKGACMVACGVDKRGADLKVGEKRAVGEEL